MNEHILPTEIEERVLEILDGPDAEHDVAIERLCRAHPEHADRIRSRIRRMREIRWDVLDVALAESEPWPERIGPFHVLDVLGEGGMGTVYLVEQEEPIRRRAALKVIKLGMDTRRVLARFETERQALGMMSHRGIARVLEAGATEQGRPWFAMELVVGRPIGVFCEERELPIRARLELFAEVCAAVEHAHQKGVIHRDLKPSNILVAEEDGRPLPKVIDFGLARAIGEEVDEKTLLTQAGGVIGTPEYMSPEQVTGGGHDVDTRTDVYALGVVLYELLTGVPPFLPTELREAGLAEMQRRIREVEPKRPSTRVTSRLRGDELRSRVSLLRGDLDWITMRALEKERDRRYQSAGELAADVRRYLANEPVLASPPSIAYRVRKFVRRNRIQVAAAAAVLVTLVAGLAVSVALWLEACAERTRAEARAAQAEQVTNFLVDLFHQASPSRSLGQDLPVRFVLSRGASQIRDELHDQPEIRARLLGTLGLAHSGLGSYDEAVALLGEALDTAATAPRDSDDEALRWEGELGDVLVARGDYAEAERMLADAMVSDVAARNEWARARLATVRAGALAGLGDYDGAESLARDAIDAFRRVRGGDSVDLALALVRLGQVLDTRGDAVAARDRVQEAVEMVDRLYPQGHPDSVLCRSALMRPLLALGDFAGAEQTVDRVLADAERIFGTQHPEYAKALLQRAHFLTRMGRDAEAEPVLRRAIGILEALVDPDHPVVAWLLNDLGTVLEHLSRHAEARDVLQRAHDIFATRHEGDHVHLAIVKGNLAEALSNLGEGERAETLAREGLAMLRRVGPNPEYEVTALTSLAWVLTSNGRLDEAAELLEEALDFAAGLDAELDSRVHESDVLRYLCHVRNRLGDGAAAERHGLRALAQRRSRGLGQHPDTALLLYNIGWACALQGHAERAESFFRESIELYERLAPAGHPDAVWPLTHLGGMLAAARPEDALSLLERAVAIRRATLPPGHFWLVSTVNQLAGVDLQLERFEEAEPLCLEVHATWLETFGAEHEATVRARARLAELYERWGRPEKAAAWAPRKD